MAANTTNGANDIDASPTGNPSVNPDFKVSNNSSAIADDDDDHHGGGLRMHDPFGGDKLDRIAGGDDMSPSSSAVRGGSFGSEGSPTRDRRMSKEWDASKVPPSRFQKRSGSIYSTPSSRDAHLTGSTSERDKGYWEKMKEKGWIKK
ncbi:c6 zinc finger domain containing protein [Diplodia corticola]|uniref:C6 zinc finger domain containing protein n=1 Tax=Diplodia corticola TaxID=236234 RepID=A0A1J9S7J0_9PEZI|nr:c6 zinc finger domain containing protein [Diplodia corticola]OJD35565.1 c6 zinc finger domain containing protein [Diplodia corticola]